MITSSPCFLCTQRSSFKSSGMPPSTWNSAGTRLLTTESTAAYLVFASQLECKGAATRRLHKTVGLGTPSASAGSRVTWIELIKCDASALINCNCSLLTYSALSRCAVSALIECAASTLPVRIQYLMICGELNKRAGPYCGRFVCLPTISAHPRG